MPRNSSGAYSLYTPGNPVVTATAISSTWANNTLADLATAVTDSLSRSGDGGMLAPLELDDGLIGAPGLTFGSESTMGLYRAAAGDMRFVVGGTDVLTLTAAGFSVSAMEIESAAPLLQLDETDAAANERNWLMRSTAGLWTLATATDAAPTTSVTNAIAIDRTGTTVDSITFVANLVKQTATLEVESTAPIFNLDESDAASNERNWLVRAQTSQFAISTATDAAPTTAVNNAMLVNRTGTAIDQITFTAGVGKFATSGNMELEAATPLFLIDETDAPANERAWLLRSTGGAFAISTATDAAPTTPVINGFTMDRNGTAVTTFTMSGTIGTFTGTTSMDLVTPLLGATGIHNGTAPTGTVERIASGTYTPTLTAVTNVAATTSAVCQYIRVGNVVTVSGQVAVDVTAGGGVLTTLGISLPIASALATATQCAGTGIRANGTGGIYEACKISGDVANDRAQLDTISADATNQNVAFTFTYLVL